VKIKNISPLLSNDAKIAYALLKDRLELSIKNDWFDENGDIFFKIILF
jgi:hypothetical protein